MFAKQGYKPAVSPNDISHLLRLPVADIIYTHSYVFVTIKLLIFQRSSRWISHEIVHNKFAVHSQTCTSCLEELSQIAESEGKVVFISSHLLKHCSVYEHRLCLIPINNKKSEQSLHCAIAILYILYCTVRFLRRYCTSACTDNIELKIKLHQIIAINIWPF